MNMVNFDAKDIRVNRQLKKSDVVIYLLYLDVIALARHSLISLSEDFRSFKIFLSVAASTDGERCRDHSRNMHSLSCNSPLH